MKHAMALGRIIGNLAYLLDVPHRRIVRANLRLAFPEWSPEKIRLTSKRVFHNLGATVVEIFQLAGYSRSDVVARVRVDGAENWQQALEDDRGLILVSAHLGNWEFGTQFIACFMKKPALGVVKKLRYPPLNNWVHNLRTRFGTNVIYKKGVRNDEVYKMA